MEQLTKVCSKCGRELPLDRFSREKLGKLGLRPECKECRANIGRKWRADNPEKERERHRKYRANNPEKVRAHNRALHDKLPDSTVRHILALCHFPPESITPELIEYKRIQLKLYRETKNQQSNERH